MVVQGRYSISRRVKRSSTLNVMKDDIIQAHKLDKIDEDSANYLGSSISVIIFFIPWLCLVLVGRYLLKTIDLDINFFVPPLIIYCNALLMSIIYSYFFKDKYSGKMYYSVAIYQTVYIWSFLILSSVCCSLVKNDMFNHFLIEFDYEAWSKSKITCIREIT